MLRPKLLTTIAVTLTSAACASVPHNPAFDAYPSAISGRSAVTYYDVRGRTYAELMLDLQRAAPKVDGNMYVGETRAPMRWDWQVERIGSSCEIRDVSVSINARIRLPRWTPPTSVEPGLVAEWQRFLKALEDHEAGHKDISAKAGDEIVRRVSGMSGQCASLAVLAKNTAKEIVESARQEQLAYDDDTLHGLKQGTSFRPPQARASR
jgi:predicted secreted Zn-dependent protease